MHRRGLSLHVFLGTHWHGKPPPSVPSLPACLLAASHTWRARFRMHTSYHPGEDPWVIMRVVHAECTHRFEVESGCLSRVTSTSRKGRRTDSFEMADQPPPPYPGTDSEKTLLPGEAEFPSAPPPDAQSAYPPPSSVAPGQPPYPPSAQPAPYPYPSQAYPPPGAADGPPAAGTGYPASAPPVSVPPAVSYSEWFYKKYSPPRTRRRPFVGTSLVGAAIDTLTYATGCVG